MIVTRTLTEGVTLAVETTLDGRHPCKMCSAIAAGQKEEQQSQKEFELLKKSGDPKFVLMCGQSPRRLGFVERVRFGETQQSAPLRSDAPPTPPPMA